MSTPAVHDAVAANVERLRAYYNTHATRSEAWRRQQLHGIVQLLTTHRQQLITALHTDLRKPAFETTTTELTLCIAAANHATQHLHRWMQPRPVQTPLVLSPASSYVQPEPYGVVLVVGAFNCTITVTHNAYRLALCSFSTRSTSLTSHSLSVALADPVQLTLLPLLTALSAGNCVLLKPSELSAATSALLCQLLPRYLDPQAVACIEGGVDAMRAVLQQRFDHIFFTGSERVGKIVAAAAAAHLTPVLLELGGKSPVVVAEDADVVLAAKRVMWGKLLNAGQSCTAPDYALVHSSRIDEFTAECKRAIVSFYPHSPASTADFGRIGNTRHAERLAAIIDAHRPHVIHGGEYDVAGRYVAPTLLLLPSTEGAAMQEELFGPILPIISYSSLSSAIAYINSQPKPLALYLFTTSSHTRNLVQQQTSSGCLVHNDCMVQSANHSLPFGGVGSSGIGRYRGKAGFDALSNGKSVIHRSNLLDVEARYPPYSNTKLAVYETALSVVRVQQEHLVDVVKYVVVPVVAGVVAKKLKLLDWIRSNM